MSVRDIVYKILHVTLLMGLLWSLLAVGVWVTIQWYFIPQLPSLERLKDVRMQIPLQVYTKDNAFIAEYGEQHRIPVAVEQIPPLLIKAVLAAEDNRFYQHRGVDMKGLFRAIVNLLKTGEKRQGGSTITMQVARNFFLSHKRTFTRKFNEILLAFKIDEELSKEEILQLYLNKIYFGHRAYGVGAAAQVYYGVNITDLSLEQLAMLAGLPKAPSTNNPLINPERALRRRNYVLKRMLTLKHITIDEYHTAIKAPLTAKLHTLTAEVEALYVAEMVRSLLLKKLGEKAIYNGYKVFTTIDSHLQEQANEALRNTLFSYDIRHGFKGALDHVSIPKNVSDVPKWAHEILPNYPVQGNLIPSLVLKVRKKSITAYNQKVGQFKIAWRGIYWARRYIKDNKRGKYPKSAKKVVKRGDIIMARPLFRHKKRNKTLQTTGYKEQTSQNSKFKNVRWRLSQVPEVEGALVALNSNDGAIISLAGGFDFYHSKFNRATQALRQPGSSFKPFIYAAALAKGFSDYHFIDDSPISFRVPEGRWSPKNYSREYYGNTFLRTALIYSYNVSAVRLLQDLGIGYTIGHVAKFGFDRDRIPRNYTMVLGTGEVTPMELTEGYAVFANGGFRVKPYFIERIEDINGKVIFSANPLIICHRCPREVFASEKNMQSLVPHNICTQTPRYAPRVINSHDAYRMTSILKDVISFGTARKSSLQRNDIAGKTGTTNDQRDAWFVGYSPKVVTSVWVGFDLPRSLGRSETGGTTALPMWVDFMKAALAKSVKPFPKPPGYIENSPPEFLEIMETLPITPSIQSTDP